MSAPAGGTGRSASTAPETSEPKARDVPEVAWRGRIRELSGEDRRALMERRPADEGGRRSPGAGEAELAAEVRGLIAEVRERGDEALLAMAARFDGVELDTLEVPRGRWSDAVQALEPGLRGALERAARNIEAFHRAQIPAEMRMETEPGVTLGRRFTPLARVGVYAPGGRAAYPSSVLMGVVPARAVGVEEVVVSSPPGEGGLPSTLVMAAAAIGGADRLFVAGGAGAVAAMTFGTGSVPRCDAVVGPGNRWVLEAKRQVAGEVVIDSPAGPSEVLVLADETADPERVAAELVAQAEHDPDAAVVLVSTSAELLEAVEGTLAAAVATAPRRDDVEEALAARGAILLADSREEALDLARAWAPEHLAIHTSDPLRDLERIPTAGTAFLGGSASVAFGDYLTGANHVLPTAGTARSFSGLSALDFMRSYTWQEVTPEAAERLADDVVRLAEAEGLPGHGAAALAAAGGAQAKRPARRRSARELERDDATGAAS